jgi:transcriptional regulator with PAS, ATPase and Fis domain
LHTNTRVIAATHIELAGAVARRQFRQDLFYRLNVLPIAIPSLRERGPEDIRALARFFLSRGKNRPPKVTPAAMQTLSSHSWPGNVRELENTIQRALHNHAGELLDAGDLGLQASPIKSPMNAGTLKGMEREHILGALKQRNHNMAASAKTLGISRASLYRKLKAYGHSLKEARAARKTG